MFIPPLALAAFALTVTDTLLAQVYSDAINVNYAQPGNIVTGEQETPQTPTGVLAQNWNNITNVGFGGPSQGGVYFAPVFAAPPVTALGATVPTFFTNVQNGGWGTVTITPGSGGANTLTQYQASNNSGSNFGNPPHWNWYLHWENLPASFNNYDVWALNDDIWVKVASNQTTSSGETTPHLVVYKTAAIQFLQISPPPYLPWISGFYPTPDDPRRSPDADPDNDGLANGIEFVTGSDPTKSSPSPLRCEISGGDVVFAFERVTLSKHASISVSLQVSPTLSDPMSWTPYPVPDSPIAPIDVLPNGNVENIILTLPRETNTTMFARLKVAITP